jgi:hypothetical protein
MISLGSTSGSAYAIISHSKYQQFIEQLGYPANERLRQMLLDRTMSHKYKNNMVFAHGSAKAATRSSVDQHIVCEF